MEKQLDRRDFLKGLGVATLGTMAFALTGCGTNDGKTEEKEKTIDPEIEEKAIPDKYWKSTGNIKVLEPEQHFIYIMQPIYASAEYKNGEIPSYPGYAYVSSETITAHEGYGSATHSIKYNFINITAVKALEYKNIITGEVSYSLPGTPINLEDIKDKPKVYTK